MSYFQGGEYIELLSAQGKSNSMEWKMQGKIMKSFHKPIKGNAFYLDGTMDTKMILPKPSINSKVNILSLHQRYLIIQIILSSTKLFSIEIGVSDFQHCRRRLIISSAFREIVSTALHVQIPLSRDISRDKWIHLVFDLQTLTDTHFTDISWNQFRALDSICINGWCRIKRIFTMNQVPKDDLNTKLICIPKQLQFTDISQHGGIVQVEYFLTAIQDIETSMNTKQVPQNNSSKTQNTLKKESSSSTLHTKVQRKKPNSVVSRERSNQTPERSSTRDRKFNGIKSEQTDFDPQMKNIPGGKLESRPDKCTGDTKCCDEGMSALEPFRSVSSDEEKCDSDVPSLFDETEIHHTKCILSDSSSEYSNSEDENNETNMANIPSSVVKARQNPLDPEEHSNLEPPPHQDTQEDSKHHLGDNETMRSASDEGVDGILFQCIELPNPAKPQRHSEDVDNSYLIKEKELIFSEIQTKLNQLTEQEERDDVEHSKLFLKHTKLSPPISLIDCELTRPKDVASVDNLHKSNEETPWSYIKSRLDMGILKLDDMIKENHHDFTSNSKCVNHGEEKPNVDVEDSIEVENEDEHKTLEEMLKRKRLERQSRAKEKISLNSNSNHGTTSNRSSEIKGDASNRLVSTSVPLFQSPPSDSKDYITNIHKSIDSSVLGLKIIRKNMSSITSEYKPMRIPQTPGVSEIRQSTLSDLFDTDHKIFNSKGSLDPMNMDQYNTFTASENKSVSDKSDSDKSDSDISLDLHDEFFKSDEDIHKDDERTLFDNKEESHSMKESDDENEQSFDFDNLILHNSPKKSSSNVTTSHTSTNETLMNATSTVKIMKTASNHMSYIPDGLSIPICPSPVLQPSKSARMNSLLQSQSLSLQDKDNDDTTIELVYDPILKCYFDPKANKYYTLAKQ